MGSSLGDVQNTAIIPAVPGRDHASLALLPFTVTTDADPPVSFSYQIRVDERMRRVSVTLDTVRSARLPVPTDQGVFLGLLQLALRSPEPGSGLEFTRTELFELLHWTDRHDGYGRLRDALHRLTALLITIHSEALSRNGRPYLQRDQGMHLIDRYDIGRGRAATCTIIWGDLVQEAFRLGDFKSLDWDLLLSLGNPLTGQLYRLLDRVVMSGEQSWTVGWRPLAAALGMNVESYARPARFKQVLQPHLDILMENGVLDSFDYRRGGTFVFHVRNYLRSQLRRVLRELGVYEEAARQVVAGYDEVAIMAQCDCLQHGGRRPDQPGGYIVNAIRESYPLRYPDDDAEAFVALWEMLSDAERHAYHLAGLKLCGVGESLFETRPDPTAWRQEMRAVVRCMICHAIDPEQVVGQHPSSRRPEG